MENSLSSSTVGEFFCVQKPHRIFLLFLEQHDLWKASEFQGSQLVKAGLGAECYCNELLLEVQPMPHPNGLDIVIRRFWHMKLRRVGWFRPSDLEFLDQVYPS